MKRLVYLEDDANMRKHTVTLLKDAGYDVTDFRRIDLAKAYFSANMNNIDCIITDLNMADEWLEDYRDESDGCMLSGWVWVNRFVFPYKPNMPVIIYSGYNPILSQHLQEKDKSALQKSNLILVDKGAEKGEGIDGLKRNLVELLGE